jgi:transcription elongation factor Elf1
MTKEIDCNFTREIICPWCGHEKSNSWEYPDYDTEICGVCGNKFDYYRNVSVTYSTEKLETEENHE